jgi:MFS family permease
VASSVSVSGIWYNCAFYLGYCLFEVPGNIILDKVGARLWIARIMITWGMCSAATAFVVGPNSFLAVRFLLGLAEAGLFPGIVLLFTYWFPDHHRARIISGFTLALPILVALGAPISTAILGMDGYLGIVTASLGIVLFIPQMIKSLGATNMGTGFATMLAYICGAISMVVWGWISDRMGERRWNLFWAGVLATMGLVFAGLTMGTWWALVGLCIATAGFYGTKGLFWSMPSMLLTGAAAAGGIAWINSIGNVGGFFGPTIVGWIKGATGSYSGGLYGLAAFTAMSALIAAFALHIPRQIPTRDCVGVPAE